MKKIVLTFGVISGAIMSVLMILALVFHDAIGFDRGLVVGYTSMVVAFLLVFFGVRSYRDNVAGGTVRFGRAFAVGSLIALVASLFYVATWEVIYFNFMPNYLEQYSAHVLDKARANGESPAAIARKQAEMANTAKLYRNPVINVGMTLLEPLPVALIVALVTAGILSRGRKSTAGDDTVLAGARTLA